MHRDTFLDEHPRNALLSPVLETSTCQLFRVQARSVSFVSAIFVPVIPAAIATRGDDGTRDRRLKRRHKEGTACTYTDH